MLNMGDSERIVNVLLEELGPRGVTVGAEVGVYRGSTSAKLLGAFPRLSPLYMIDRWSAIDVNDITPEEANWYRTGDSTARQDAAEVRQTKAAAEVATWPCRSRRCMMQCSSTEASIILHGVRLDFVFQDDDHSYEGVARGISEWWPMVRRGGVHAWHDYDHPRNKKGFFGVNRAVDEFIGREGLHLQRNGSVSYVIKR